MADTGDARPPVTQTAAFYACSCLSAQLGRLNHPQLRNFGREMEPLPCGSAFLKAFPASTKLVAASCLLCSCRWSCAAWQKAFPAAGRREKQARERGRKSFQGGGGGGKTQGVGRSLTPPASPARNRAKIRQRRRACAGFQTQRGSNPPRRRRGGERGPSPGSRRAGALVRTAPVFGHFEHVCRSGVDVACFLYPGGAPGSKREAGSCGRTCWEAETPARGWGIKEKLNSRCPTPAAQKRLPGELRGTSLPPARLRPPQGSLGKLRLKRGLTGIRRPLAPS